MLSDKELELIRRKMAELETEPPEKAWEYIKAGIKPRHRFKKFWWVAAACLLSGLLIVGSWHVYNQQNNVVMVKNSRDHQRNNDKQLPAITAPESTSDLKNKNLGFSKGDFQSEFNLRKKPVNTFGAGIPVFHGVKNKNHYRKNRSMSTVSVPQKRNRRKAFSGTEVIPSEKAIEEPQVDQVPDLIDTSDTLQGSRKNDSVKTKALLAAPDSNRKKKKKDWDLGMTIAPAYVSRILVPVRTDTILITRLTNRDEINFKRLGLELGLHVTKPLYKQLHLEAGLSLLKLQDNLSYTYTNGMVDSVQYTSMGPDQVKIKTHQVTYTRELNSSYLYGGVRAGLLYYFRERPTGRLNVLLAGGANALIIGTTKQYHNGVLHEPFGGAGRDSMLVKSNYNISVGIGYNRNLNDLFEIRIMPAFSYFLGSIYVKQEAFRLSPYYIGLTISLNYKAGSK